MTFISYAQNCEDVLLWRALGHIKNGFYIDVGANDPVDHSVTKAFYDAGWNGINIEPLPALHQQFVAERPRDTNLGIAAGASDGILTLFDVPSVNGWASPDRAVAEAHRADGFEVAELQVPVRTLAGVCANYVKGDIHFLKVDVEGFEGEVLRGMDFERWRPWVLVIEATMPNSRVTNHETWEALVTSRRYRYAYFDGLNRYYVAEEHAELLAALSIPPNVFDNYITRHLDQAWREKERAEAAIVLAEDRVARADANRWEAEKRGDREYQRAQDALAHGAALQEHIEHVAAEHARAEAWGRDLETRLIATLNSTSWRVTKPLRKLGTLVHRFRAVPLRARAGSLARRILTRLTRNERVRRLFIPLLLRFPAQATKVSRTINAIKQGPSQAPSLPASAQKVLADLQRARRNPESK